MENISISSNDSSPYPSPFGSPISSPNSSRQHSPTRLMSRSYQEYPKTLSLPPRNGLSKLLVSSTLSLQRANSYRQKTKKSTSHLDDLIKKRKVLSRLRSKSTPNINYDNVDNIDNSHSSTSDHSDHSDQETPTENARYSDNEKYVTSNKNQNKEKRKSSCPQYEKEHKETKKSPTMRKKSLSALLDLKKNIIGQGPRLKRSQSQRFTNRKLKYDNENKKIKSYSTDDHGKSEYKGPLFQATTMFVPGYDFKKKQSTPLVPRRQSTPLFGRRGSKEKIQPVTMETNKEKQRSTPNLARRGSKDKIKIIEIKTDDLKFQRADSLPPHITLNGDYEDDDFDEDDDFLSIPERQTLIKQKQMKFVERNKATRVSSLELPGEGKVKKISTTYEHGTNFWHKYKQRKKQTVRDMKHRSCEIEHDSIYRRRAQSYESGEAFIKQHSYSDVGNDSLSSQGSESGYASPTDNNNSELYNTSGEEYQKQKKSPSLKPSFKQKPKIVLHSPSFNDTYSNSWSQGQWRNKQNISPDLARVFATDLCVTEL